MNLAKPEVQNPKFKKPEVQAESEKPGALADYLLGLDSDSETGSDDDQMKTMELLGDKTGNAAGRTLLGLDGSTSG